MKILTRLITGLLAERLGIQSSIPGKNTHYYPSENVWNSLSKGTEALSSRVKVAGAYLHLMLWLRVHEFRSAYLYYPFHLHGMVHSVAQDKLYLVNIKRVIILESRRGKCLNKST